MREKEGQRECNVSVAEGRETANVILAVEHQCSRMHCYCLLLRLRAFSKISLSIPISKLVGVLKLLSQPCNSNSLNTEAQELYFMIFEIEKCDQIIKNQGLSKLKF